MTIDSRLWRLVFGLVCTAGVLSQTACASEKTTQVENAQKVFAGRTSIDLAQAAAAGDSARVRELVRSGADPDAVGDGRTSMLQWALLNRSAAGLQALLIAGADPAHADDTGDTVVHYAAKANDPAYLDILLAHHANPDVPNAITGATPLMDALRADRDTQFAKLVAAGADLNRADSMGNTALHVAAKINSTHVLDLLEAGSDPLLRNRQNQTFQVYLAITPARVLTEQARDNRRQIADWLRRHGVEPTFTL